MTLFKCFLSKIALCCESDKVCKQACRGGRADPGDSDTLEYAEVYGLDAVNESGTDNSADYRLGGRYGNTHKLTHKKNGESTCDYDNKSVYLADLCDLSADSHHNSLREGENSDSDGETAEDSGDARAGKESVASVNEVRPLAGSVIVECRNACRAVLADTECRECACGEISDLNDQIVVTHGSQTLFYKFLYDKYKHEGNNGRTQRIDEPGGGELEHFGQITLEDCGA